jgi:hypothetical protein
MCQASNYRPITLLNSDYKVLARVLAERFGKIMPACIGVEQTAYLSVREIGGFDMQLFAANLSLLGQRGAVVLLVIPKAFDTIDRALLLAIIERCGGGPGMRRWIHLLPLHTPALWSSAAEQLPHSYGLRASARAAHCRPFCTSLWPKLLLDGCVLTVPFGIILAGQRIVSSHRADERIPARSARRDYPAPFAARPSVWPGRRPVWQPAEVLGRPAVWNKLSYRGQQCRWSADCGEATSLVVAIKPVDALRLQHSHTASPGLRPQHCRPCHCQPRVSR